MEMMCCKEQRLDVLCFLQPDHGTIVYYLLLTCFIVPQHCYPDTIIAFIYSPLLGDCFINCIYVF